MGTEAMTALSKTIRSLKSENANGQGVQEQKWLQNHLIEPALQALVPKLSIIALHILSALLTEPKTGIELATQLEVTRGGITRAAKKLADYQLITAQKRPDDQKKIYYTLTSTGQTIAQTHDQMHQALKTQVIDALVQKYSSADIQIVDQFLKDLMAYEQRFY